jgi:glycine/D-amino acid oxidase-like deaminating enzyme
MNNNFGIEDAFGGVELGNGCKVIHVPSYLRGLWEECETKAEEKNGSIKWELIQMPSEQDIVNDSFNQQLAQHDAVILSAGAGIIYDQLISKEDMLPVQLVRGQSIEMIMPNAEEYPVSNEAFLCGKYISPLPQSNTQQNRFVIGATHEFKADELSPVEVMDELKSRTYPLARRLWDHGEVERLTTGVRMQSNRGSFGMYLFMC